MSEETNPPKQKLYYDQRSVALRTSQSVYFVQEHDKISMLELVLKNYDDTQIVMITKSKKKADILSAFLVDKAFKASSVHGNHREEKQKEVAARFNLKAINIIITTDMIFKVLDLENVQLIVNYDLPDVVQEYYNRLAFMEEKGEAIAFVSPEDDKLLSNIEFNMKAEIKEGTVEGFIPSTSTQSNKTRKDKKKKPRHRKMK